MTISMYQASVPVFQHQLGALSKILAKADAHVAGRKLDCLALTQARLFPDMFPLSRQVQIASDAAKGAIARLASADIPSYEDTETNFAELIERCDKTSKFLGTFSPAQIDGTEEKEIVLNLRGTSVTFPGQQYLLGFAMPNFYFHMTTAYNLLRHGGVDIGKRDFLGAN